MLVNGKGEPAVETYFFSEWDFETQDQMARALIALSQRLGIVFVDSNATEYGEHEMRIEEYNYDNEQ